VAAEEAPNPNVPLLVLLVLIQVIYVCMIYGPIAAYLAEASPARIRYTSLSLPYHIGNGVFGGLVPLIGVYICASTQNIYAGLYYPMTVAALTLVIGTLVLKETHGTKIWDEVGGHPPPDNAAQYSRHTSSTATLGCAATHPQLPAAISQIAASPTANLKLINFTIILPYDTQYYHDLLSPQSPHWHPENRPIFLTWRLYNSLPASIVSQARTAKSVCAPRRLRRASASESWTPPSTKLQPALLG